MDNQLAKGKVTIRWIEDGDIASDLEVIAAQLRLTRSELIRQIVREAIARHIRITH